MQAPTVLPSEGVRELLGRFRAFSQDLKRQTDEQTLRVKARLDSFWPEFLEARRIQAQFDRDKAPGFNLFRLLNLEGVEAVHTQFLADLLNPSGAHGQGALFLERFLCAIDREGLAAALKNTAAQVWVTSEFHLDSGKRPDIALSCPYQFLLVIENKISQGESEGQLQNYRDWLDRYVGLDEAKRVLVFLTVHGAAGPKSLAGHYIRFSYLPGVEKWLKDCLPHVRAPRVEQVLMQYLQTVRELYRFKKEDLSDDEE